MIAVDFPPAITAGSLRLASFARYLPTHDWETSVVTIRRSFHDPGDPALERSLPPDCRIARAVGFDTKTVFSWRGRYLGLLAFPDRMASWVADGIRQSLRACRHQRLDAILSSSPPVSSHLIAFVVKRLTGLPWVADLRDPWNLDNPYGTFLRGLDRHLERRLLSAADRITVVTAGAETDLQQRHGDGIRSRLRRVANGYDESAMARALENAERPASFRVVHIGACMTSYRSPEPLLRAVRLSLDRGDLPVATSIELIGTPADPTLANGIARLGLDPRVSILPRVSHREALEAAAHAAALLLLQTRPDSDPCIPVKAYEYLRTDRPILAIVRPGGETAKLLQGFDGVTLVPPTDIEGIATALRHLYRKWAAGRDAAFNRDVTRYSRQHLAAEMAEVLDGICVTAGAPAA